MHIRKDTVVTLAYRLTTLEGQLLEEATDSDPAAYLHGGYGGIFAKAEAALEGKQAGDEVDVVLAPAEAFGEYDDQLVQALAASAAQSEDRAIRDLLASQGISYTVNRPAPKGSNGGR